MRRELKLYLVLASVAAVVVGTAFVRVLTDLWMPVFVAGALGD